jgi:hypothetical protein
MMSWASCSIRAIAKRLPGSQRSLLGPNRFRWQKKRRTHARKQLLKLPRRGTSRHWNASTYIIMIQRNLRAGACTSMMPWRRHFSSLWLASTDSRRKWRKCCPYTATGLMPRPLRPLPPQRMARRLVSLAMPIGAMMWRGTSRLNSGSSFKNSPMSAALFSMPVRPLAETIISGTTPFLPLP